MADTVSTGRITKRHKQRPSKTGHKLPSLPSDAQITKRPLLRPAIPSPYSGPSQQKIVYISAKTPFMSAVKRAEKLLHLSDKRLVQSATQLSKDARNKKRRWERREDEDEIREEVVLKGTGKAIGKVMELGLWFQQRDAEYHVRLKTGSVFAVEDVQYEEEAEKHASAGAQVTEDVVQAASSYEIKQAVAKPMSKVMKREEHEAENGKKEISETRIRQLSVLEVYISLR
ncbi:uncharacterized protein SEPMUDRAFT_75002 [Sphaerulina musiva SO2202]|uniref:Uncharacterized protein n=1 Tax=Sphaerulina musiva (strain SO2202) TaxID=692275 RepID=M3CVN3_SPHMS|nr:uncharacterized protein SEPMUDRAFT_75002 [Sphaerulina musiva SO2202]EMF08202.1 hypothetical protein SEPMUDRAFT_75002 [Sphaerulina musiva SO2202]